MKYIKSLSEMLPLILAALVFSALGATSGSNLGLLNLSQAQPRHQAPTKTQSQSTATSPDESPDKSNDDDQIILNSEAVERLISVSIIDKKSGQSIIGITADDLDVYEGEVKTGEKNAKGRVLQTDSVLLRQGVVPVDAYLVLDFSWSMLPKRTLIRDAALRFRDFLDENDRVRPSLFATRAYNTKKFPVYYMENSNVHDMSGLTGDANEYKNRVEHLFATAPTHAPHLASRVYDTIFEVLEEAAESDPSRRRALVVMTDFQDTMEGDKARLIYYAKEAGVPIYFLKRKGDIATLAIGEQGGFRIPLNPNPFGRHREQGAMDQIAEDTGGSTYKLEGSLKDLDDGLADIATTLKTTYVLSYVPSNPKLDGTLRDVRIQFKDKNLNKKYVLRYPKQYRATPRKSSQHKLQKPQP